MKGIYKEFTAKSTIDFVFMLRNRTTSELCRDFPKHFKVPKWNGSQDDAVKDMLAIDAIQWKLTGEYVKFCRIELSKKLFDKTDKENCLFKGWKYSKKDDEVYTDEFTVNLTTLSCYQVFEGGYLDFQLIGNTIGQMFDVIKDIELTDLAIKKIFGTI